MKDKVIIVNEKSRSSPSEEKLLQVLRIVIQHGYSWPELQALFTACNIAGPNQTDISRSHLKFSPTWTLLRETFFHHVPMAKTSSETPLSAPDSKSHCRAASVQPVDTWTHSHQRMLNLYDTLSGCKLWSTINKQGGVVLNRKMTFAKAYLDLAHKVPKDSSSGKSKSKSKSKSKASSKKSLRDLIEHNTEFCKRSSVTDKAKPTLNDEELTQFYDAIIGSQNEFVTQQVEVILKLYGEHGHCQNSVLICYKTLFTSSSKLFKSENGYRIIAVLQLCEFHLRRMCVLLLRKMEVEYYRLSKHAQDCLAGKFDVPNNGDAKVVASSANAESNEEIGSSSDEERVSVNVCKQQQAIMSANVEDYEEKEEEEEDDEASIFRCPYEFPKNPYHRDSDTASDMDMDMDIDSEEEKEKQEDTPCNYQTLSGLLSLLTKQHQDVFMLQNAEDTLLGMMFFCDVLHHWTLELTYLLQTRDLEERTRGTYNPTPLIEQSNSHNWQNPSLVPLTRIAQISLFL
jgi:hypothetical protein